MAHDANRPEPDLIRDQVESVTRRVKLALMRGQADEAERLAAEAVEQHPRVSAFHELMGDVLRHRSQTRRARDAYKQAVELDPLNRSAEAKYGETVLAIETALAGPLPDYDPSFAGAKAAMAMSFLVPGLGQLVSGHTTKGGAFLAAWVLGWLFAFLVPGGMVGLGSLFGGRGPAFEPLVLLPLGLAFGAWLMAVLDASQAARTLEPKKVERPVPPVDKKFEL